MLNKIFWWFILIIVLYLLLVFKAPVITLGIEKTIWIKWITEFVINFKNKYDDTVTTIPSKSEVQDTYNVIYSWAVDYKEKFVNWANVTKWKIDIIREKISWAEDTYNELLDWYEDVKESYDDAKVFIDENKEKLDIIKDAIDSVSNKSSEIHSWFTDTINSFSWLTNTWITN